MSDLETQIKEMARIRTHVIPNGSEWKHLNTGRVYVAYHTLLIEATLEVGITYSAHGSHHVLWMRPVSEFLDGRFERVK